MKNLKNPFQQLTEQMNQYIAPHIMERGFDYYLQGQVEEVEIGETWIKATVLGSYGDYWVKVHRERFSLSECDCPYEDYCKHMAAVIYQVAAAFRKKFTKSSLDHSIFCRT